MGLLADMREAKKRFREDTKDHVLLVLLDSGLYRHVRIGKPQSSTYRFDLITWPGYLSVAGDMGEYVFQRTTDMFSFFKVNINEAVWINPGYWSEKLQAADARNGFEEFDGELFKQRIVNRIRESSWENRGKLLREVREEVFPEIEQGEFQAMEAVYHFKSEDGYTFSDIFVDEGSCKKFTFHFLWICWGIAYGIRAYDRYKAKSGGLIKLWQD